LSRSSTSSEGGLLKPPSTKPADELSLDLPTTTTTTPDTTPDDTTVDTIATTTTEPQPEPPEPLANYVQPALAGEGQWVPVAKADGLDAIWVTSFRPLADYASVVATVVVVDPCHQHVQQPRPARRHVGRRSPARNLPTLLARNERRVPPRHLYGGYMAEGRREAVGERAEKMITRDGKMVIGELGRDLFDDGTWQSLRQNGILMVDDGQPQMERAKRERVSWGAAGTGDLFVNRSAVCDLGNGRFGYVMADRVEPAQMAQVLIEAGCVRAIQLDINGQWPNFTVFAHGADGVVVSFTVDKRMRADEKRYLQVTSKEFFAFFDATLVPATSALDA
jgi:hypothetical protein